MLVAKNAPHRYSSRFRHGWKLDNTQFLSHRFNWRVFILVLRLKLAAWLFLMSDIRNILRPGDAWRLSLQNSTMTGFKVRNIDLLSVGPNYNYSLAIRSGDTRRRYLTRTENRYQSCAGVIYRYYGGQLP
jgi:hypothetical protein